jgi:hypothetical protein
MGEYTLVDCDTGLIYGPYETFAIARTHAEAFKMWEIITDDERLVDWSRPDPIARQKASFQEKLAKRAV